MILTVDVATSLQRRRAFIGHDAYKTWFDNQFLNRFQRFFLLAADARLAPKTHVIDTTFMSETQVVQTLAVELNCQLPTLKNSTS